MTDKIDNIIKNTIIIVLIILSTYLFYQNQKLDHSSALWMEMYWEQVEENIWLEGELDDIKRITEWNL
jgi:hypothetical protein